MEKHYATILTVTDKSGMTSLGWFGHTTSSWLSTKFNKTCMMRANKLCGGRVCAIEFSSLADMILYMRDTYGYTVTGDDKIVSIPIKGTLSPYYGQYIVTTLDDIFNSDSQGFIHNAEARFIDDDMECIFSIVGLRDDYFTSEFKDYARIIFEAAEYIMKILNSITDDSGNAIIDVDNWDVPQYGILKGWYEV